MKFFIFILNIDFSSLYANKFKSFPTYTLENDEITKFLYLYSRKVKKPRTSTKKVSRFDPVKIF